MMSICAASLMSLLMSQSMAVRTDVNVDSLASDELEQNITSFEARCPGVCMSLNYAFMKADDISDQKVREEVNKKCRFEMCQGCMGGGSNPKASIPCCTEGCELKTKTPSVHEMAAAIGKSVTPEVESFDSEVADDEEDDKDVMMPVRTFARGPRGPRVSEKEMPEEVEPIVMEYKAAQGEVCSYDHGKAWCMFPAKNPGNKYRKNGKPLCCQKVTAADTKEENEDIETEAMELIENSKKPIGEQTPVIEPGCADGATFGLKAVTLKDVQQQICMNEQTKLPADVKCCAKEAPVVTTFTAANIAELECEDVEKNHCKDVKTFEKVRHTKYKNKIPGGYSCKRMYWCVDQTNDITERVGPVDHVSMCGDLQLTGYRTCAAVPYP
mmetsp:Transcript_20993/g.48190  ORF Transcript_20993/g.48190 Transcript_20993/m.48190 type:complete len:383 (+) Transcript_20993:65-1213(+)